MHPSWKFCSVLIIVLITFVHEGFSIQCWSCRSDHDPKCADPFDNTTVPIVNCKYEPDLPNLPGIKPTMCRKTRQKVNGKWIIIRGCADWDRPRFDWNEKSCVTEPQINATSMDYCICDNKDGCNTGPMVFSNRLVVLFAAFLTCFTVRFYNQ